MDARHDGDVFTFGECADVGEASRFGVAPWCVPEEVLGGGEPKFGEGGRGFCSEEFGEGPAEEWLVGEGVVGEGGRVAHGGLLQRQ